MQQTDQPNILSPTSGGETTAAPLLYAQAAASSSIAPPGVDATMQKVPTGLPDEGGAISMHFFSDAHSAMHAACNQVVAFAPKELADSTTILRSLIIL